MDRVAYGGVVVSDVRIIETHPDRKFDIRGVDNHEITAIPLVTAGGVASTITAEVIVIMNQCECHSKNKTMYSFPRVEHCKNIVDYHYIKVGRGKHVSTLDEYKIPMYIRGNYITFHYVLALIKN